MVTWQTPIPQQSHDIHGRIYNADGAAVGDEFLVNTTVQGDQVAPDVAGLPGGRFVAAWESGGIVDGQIRAILLHAGNNTAPTVAPINSLTTLEDTASAPLAVPAGDVDGDSLFYALKTGFGPDKGTVSTFGGIGSFVYTPFANVNGNDNFTIVVSDGFGGTVEQVVSVTITPVNDAPSFTVGVNQSIAEDAGPQNVNGFATAISKGPADESAQTVDFIVSNNNSALFSSQPTIDAAGNLHYAPALNANGNATVTVQIRDNGGTANGGRDTSAAQTFNIVVTPVNDAPLAQNGSAAGEQVITSTLAATDIDSATLTYAMVTQAVHGSVTVNANGTFTYTANSGYSGPDGFTFKANDGALDSNVATESLTVTLPTFTGASGFDFDGDGKGDILFQDTNGTAAVWTMNGTSISSLGAPLPNPGTSWHVIDANDFDGDHKADILWQNDNGAAAVWLMNGTSVSSFGAPLPSGAGAAWHVKEAADFNGDGKADILWQNDSGAAAVWLMNGTGATSFGSPLPNPGTSWHVKDAADFNGDHKADILWQNDNGAAAVWLMDGVNVVNEGPALPNPGTSWHAMAAADFNADGKADILWQNDNGAAAVWLMDGASVLAMGPALENPGTSWHVKEAADYNADGKADILWQNDNGTGAVWLMNGTDVQSLGAPLTNPGAEWHIV